MSTENYVKLMFLRLRKEVIFLITLGVFMLMIKSMGPSNQKLVAAT